MDLLSLYIAATVFGVGVTAIDMMGILGDLFDEGGDSDGGDDGLSSSRPGPHVEGHGGEDR